MLATGVVVIKICNTIKVVFRRRHTRRITVDSSMSACRRRPDGLVLGTLVSLNVKRVSLTSSFILSEKICALCHNSSKLSSLHFLWP